MITRHRFAEFAVEWKKSNHEGHEAREDHEGQLAIWK